MRKTVSQLATTFLLLVCVVASTYAVPQYKYVDLSSLLPDGAQLRFGMAVNDAGQVACTTDRGVYVYSAETGFQLLPMEGLFQTSVRSINNLGQVAGTYWGLGDRAFVFTPGQGAVDIGEPEGYGECRPVSINDSGWIAAVCGAWGIIPDEPFICTPGQGFWQITVPNAVSSMPADMNEQGQVVGTSMGDSGQFAWVHTPAVGTVALEMLDQQWMARGDTINNWGQVAGMRLCTDLGLETAYLYTPESGIQDLGNPGGFACNVYGMNDSGWIIGDCLRAQTGPKDAWLYTPQDGMVNLNESVLGPAIVTRPFGINNNGWIVGTVVGNTGGARAFLLIPTVSSVTASVSIQPGTLNLKAKAPYVMCRIELQSDERTVWDIVPESLRLQGDIIPSGVPVYGDADGNSIPDMTIQFSRPALLSSLELGVQTVQLTGSLTDGCEITGEDTVRVQGK